ncbi:hypothetical protein V6N13_135910 [Hibiscus sabdariffa]
MRFSVNAAGGLSGLIPAVAVGVKHGRKLEMWNLLPKKAGDWRLAPVESWSLKNAGDLGIGSHRKLEIGNICRRGASILDHLGTKR